MKKFVLMALLCGMLMGTAIGCSEPAKTTPPAKAPGTGAPPGTGAAK